MQRHGYWVRVALGLDQFVNTILGGWADETLSSRAWRRREIWYWRWLAVALNTIAPGHCRRAWRSEILRRQAPPETR